MRDMNLFQDKVRVFDVTDLTSLQLNSTSKGNQQKWYNDKEDLYVKGQFYYQNKYWRDDLVEVIATVLGEQLLLDDKCVSVVHQELCEIQKEDTIIKGTYSKNFCARNERFISFYRILQLNNVEFPYTESVTVKWDFVLDMLNEFTKCDCTNYLVTMSLLDFLVGNEDRHLSNFGLLTDEKTFSIAPLFDFGLGLFEHDRRYDNIPFRQCLSLMECKPFSKDNSKVIEFLQSKYDLNEYLPKTFDLSDVELPSGKAESYVLNRVHYLGCEVEGI